MRALLFAFLLAAPSAVRADGAFAKRVRACVKRSQDVPQAVAAGAGLFASVTRVDLQGPYANCDVVVETESFGVGWLMRAWMKEAVTTPCGKRLGSFKFTYKGDAWQAKIVTGLHEFLKKHPEAFAKENDCVNVIPGT